MKQIESHGVGDLVTIRGQVTEDRGFGLTEVRVLDPTTGADSGYKLVLPPHMIEGEQGDEAEDRDRS